MLCLDTFFFYQLVNFIANFLSDLIVLDYDYLGTKEKL